MAKTRRWMEEGEKSNPEVWFSPGNDTSSVKKEALSESARKRKKKKARGRYRRGTMLC